MAKDPNLYVAQLTSVRGLACLVVLVGHVIQVIHYHFAAAGFWSWLARALVTYAFNAEAAVLLFFVLSGCVLSLSLRNLKAPLLQPVLGFYVKRVFRIYPLLWLGVEVALLSMVVVQPLVGHGVFVDWLERNLGTALTLPHVLMALSGMYTRYNGPMWSLRVELVYSLMFPAFFLLVRHLYTRMALLATLLVVALLPLPTQIGTAFGFSFAMGALIPMLPKPLGRFHGLAAAVALLVLLYDRFLLVGLHPPERVFDCIETVSAFVLIRDVYGSGRTYRLLVWRPLILLGEFSFSIYLLHLPILLMIFTELQRVVGLPTLLDHPSASQVALSVLTILVTVSVSAATYHLVELPFHDAGRQLGRRIGQRGMIERRA